MTKQELTYEFSKRYLEFITLNFSPNELMAMWRAKSFGLKAEEKLNEITFPKFEKDSLIVGTKTEAIDSLDSNNERISSKNLSISQAGIGFIKSWEGFENEPYNDSEGFYTIGSGL